MKKIFSFLLLGLLLSVGNAWATDTYELTTTITDGDYVIGCIIGAATDDNTIAAINTTVNGGWGKYTTVTPSDGVISDPESELVWKLTKISDNSFSLKNGTSYYKVSTGTGSGSVSISNNASTIYFEAVGNSTDAFELSGVSTFTVSSGNQLACNLGSGYGYRQYTQRTHAITEGGITTQIRFYKKSASGETSPSVSFSAPTTEVNIGETVTNVATTENAGEAAISYSSDNIEIATVNTSTGVVTGVAAGSATITATITVNEVEYTDSYIITVIDPNAPGTENNPYTVAQAIAATPESGTSSNVYIHGIVSSFYKTSIVGDGTNYRYYISDDGTTTTQLLVFKGKGLNENDFSNVNDLLVGDEVTIYGGLTTYNSTKEIAAGNYIVSLQRPTVTVEAPTFSPEAGTYTSAQNVTLSCATDGATIYYTTDGTDPTNASAQYSAAISVAEYTTIKAIAIKGNDQSTIASATYHICSAQNPYTVTQALAFAEYPANGIYVHGIVSTAPTAAPNNGALTYFISVDGETTNQLQIYKGKDLENAAFTAQDDIQVGDEVTVYGNVKIYNQTKEFDAGNYLVAFNRPVVPSITVSSNTINATSAETDGTIDVTYNNLTNFLSEVRFVASDGTTPATYDWFDAEINAQDNTELDYTIGENTGNARTAYMVVYAVGDEGDATSELITISQDAYVPPTPAANYVLVTDVADIVLGAHYIIVGEKNGAYKAMGIQTNNNRAAVEVTEDNGTITVAENSGVHEFIICKDGDKFAIYEAEVGYLYAASSGSNHLKSQVLNNVNGQWDITFDEGIASIIATESTNRNVMQYNSTSTLFSCYASASQADVYLYKKTGETFTTEAVAISEVGYATLYYGEKNLIVPEGVVARTYKVENGALVETETYEAGEVVPKTIAVVLEGAEGNYDFIVTPVPGMGPAETNLKGSDEAATTVGGTYFYGLSLNSANEANSVGFYWMAENGAAFTNGAHKAYLALNELPAGAPSRILFNENNATNIQNVEGNEKAVKFIENGILYILREGVVYDATGRMVK